jgi:protease IV
MSAPSDYLIDRRKLRRKLGFWRLAAIAAAAVAVLIGVSNVTGADSIDKAVPHIARLKIEGLITGSRETLDLIDKIGESVNTRAVIVAIDSPGGTTTGSEKLYEGLRRLSAKNKPVVAVVGNIAASGGYIAALGADQIVASGNALVGSIGVLFQYPNVYKLLEHIGVQVETVKSSPLKAAPNGFEPTSEAARAALADLVTDSYGWFKGLVQERRKLDDSELAKVSDGRVFTGRQGAPLKLVDLLGGEREAIEWLETTKGVAKNLPVRDWKKKQSLERLGLLSMAAAIAKLTGYDQFAIKLEQLESSGERASLDGLVAIWQGHAQD